MDKVSLRCEVVANDGSHIRIGDQEHNQRVFSRSIHSEKCYHGLEIRFFFKTGRMSQATELRKSSMRADLAPRVTCMKKRNEVALYRVADGKVVYEEFFYNM